jgi:hypothetical protein
MRMRRDVFVMRSVIVVETRCFAPHKLRTVFPLDRAALLDHDHLGELQSRAISKVYDPFNQSIFRIEALDFDFSLCGRAVFDGLFDKFRILADITHLGCGFLSVEVLIYQILIALKQAGPLDEISTIAHQPCLEPREELNSRQAILLLKGVEFSNDRRKTFLGINRLFHGGAEGAQLRWAAFLYLILIFAIFTVPRSDDACACEARKAAFYLLAIGSPSPLSRRKRKNRIPCGLRSGRWAPRSRQAVNSNSLLASICCSDKKRLGASVAPDQNGLAPELRLK